MTKNFIGKKIIIRLQFSICRMSDEAKTDGVSTICRMSDEAKTDGVSKKAPNFKQIQI